MAQEPPTTKVVATQQPAFNAAKAIKEAMSKVVTSRKETYPLAVPIIKMNLKYKAMDHVTKASNYFKYVPSVFYDSLNFDFGDRDYQIVQRDKAFVKELNAKIAQGNGSIATNIPGHTVK